jgi:hypothetical protein
MSNDSKVGVASKVLSDEESGLINGKTFCKTNQSWKVIIEESEIISGFKTKPKSNSWWINQYTKM